MNNTSLYAVKAKELYVQKKSSSGGAFIVLSDYILALGGAIACSVYNYSTHTMEFCILESKEERDKAIGSKYIQSNPGTIYQDCELWLNDHPGKVLMFVGLGCQSSAFNMYANQKGIRDRVIIVDIVCHGVPSPKMWRDYVEFIQKKECGELKTLSFKDKRNGWLRPSAVAKVGNKEVYLRDYIRIFNSGMALRPSCHQCPYTSVRRKTDISIGDFWGIEKAHPEFVSQWGVSLVIVHSEKGQDLFEAIKPNINYIETSESECIQPQLHYPVECSKKRSKFWSEYKKRGIEYIMKKYGKVSLVEKILYKIKHFIDNLYKKYTNKTYES